MGGVYLGAENVDETLNSNSSSAKQQVTNNRSHKEIKKRRSLC